MYSWSRILTCPNHISLDFLHLSVIFHTFTVSPMFSFHAWCLAVCPSTHLHLCHFPFLLVGAGSLARSPYRTALYWLNNHLVDISFNIWWYPLIMDFTLCCPDSSRVSVDTADQSLDTNTSSASCSMQTVSSCLLTAFSLHRSAQCFPDI